MKSRILLAVVVLGAIVAWARCRYTPPSLGPAPNLPFAGCFEGPISDPQDAGTLTVVLEEPVAGDSFALGGCFKATIGEKIIFATLAGSVQEDDPGLDLAVMGAVEAGSTRFLRVQIDRRGPFAIDPDTEIDVTVEGGDPFAQAAELPRRVPRLTCRQLAASMKPAPEPVLVLP